MFVTTDKCYENREMDHAYTEEDHLGGYDPYSSSKAAAEIVISAYRRSFFAKLPVRIASARAGNVIGGGDWALDRIVPDCIRACNATRRFPSAIRTATRPWQHVLEPLSGYLWLVRGSAQEVVKQDAKTLPPRLISARTGSQPHVGELVGEILKNWPGRWEDKCDPHAVHEAKAAHALDGEGRSLLHWRPTWNFETVHRRYRGLVSTS